jgi:hypothetical protein
MNNVAKKDTDTKWRSSTVIKYRIARKATLGRMGEALGGLHTLIKCQEGRVSLWVNVGCVVNRAQIRKCRLHCRRFDGLVCSVDCTFYW